MRLPSKRAACRSGVAALGFGAMIAAVPFPAPAQDASSPVPIAMPAPETELTPILEEIEERVRRLSEKSGAVTNEADSLRSELAFTRDRVEELETMLVESRRAQGMLQTAMQTMRAETEAEVEAAARDRDAFAARNEELEGEMELARVEIGRLNEQLEAVSTRLGLLNAVLAELENDYQATRAELGTSGEAIQGQPVGAQQLLTELGAEPIRFGTLLTLPGDGLFGFDSADVDPGARPLLARVADAIGSFGNRRILIVGHTDSTGDPAYNQRLSERRAAAIRAYLASEFGIDGDRMQTVGASDSRPIASNDTPTGRRANRRVEIVIQRPGAAADVQAAAASVDAASTLTSQ